MAVSSVDQSGTGFYSYILRFTMKVLMFVSLIGRTMYFPSCSLFFELKCEKILVGMK